LSDDKKETETKPDIPLKDQIKEMNEKLNLITDLKRLDKKQNFKLKGNAKRALKRLHKKNKIVVFGLGQNKALNTEVCDVKNSYFMYKGIPRYFDTKHIYMYNGKYPTVVLPEQNTEPLIIDDNEKTSESARLKFLIGLIESNEVKAGLGLNPKMIIIFVVIGLIALFIFGGGTKLFTGGAG